MEKLRRENIEWVPEVRDFLIRVFHLNVDY